MRKKLAKILKNLKSIFDIAARTDDGESADLLETDAQGFNDLVNRTLTALNNMFKKGKDSLKQFEFIPGNSRTKQNGALTPDQMKEYENGELVRISTGYDDNDSSFLEGNEIETDLVLGNWRTKQNGALTPDRMNEYKDGKVVKTIEGFDEDGDGWIDYKMN